ncbi:hypothetical protein RB653_003736 [Dictyostelium firmibasis]|uniref:GRAM domain-containing protein n=1 Tax=Dictyostelium firmibasis TaxID=79012 RepID=A0AAN7UI02_9MYCE
MSTKSNSGGSISGRSAVSSSSTKVLLNNGKRGSDSSSVESYGSESENDLLRKNLRLEESVLFCEKCDFKNGGSFKSNYNMFGITQAAIVFFGSFSVKKKRKIVPFKNISNVEWLQDDSVRIELPIEKGKFKYYHINFKKSHKGSPFRLIESRWKSANIDPSRKLSTGEELYRNPSTSNLIKHFQTIPRDERLELSYRCRIKGSLDQNYGVMFVTQTRILFLSIDTTFKSEEIKFERVLSIDEPLPTKGKLKKSILITIGKGLVYSFSSFESKEESYDQIKYSWETFKKIEQNDQQQNKSNHHSSYNSNHLQELQLKKQQQQQLLQQQIQQQQQQILQNQQLLQLQQSQHLANPLSGSTGMPPPPNFQGSPDSNPLGYSQSVTNKPQQTYTSPNSSSSSTYGSNGSLDSNSNEYELLQIHHQQQPSSEQQLNTINPKTNVKDEIVLNGFSNVCLPVSPQNVYRKVANESYSERANKIFNKEPDGVIKQKIMKIKSRGCCFFF